mmetsp:Transcript_10346/g.42815  ORF Transcript_10346/g.42815 Transcript_10346/m.42815 type:complete len:246 (-) Transcript_10346:155-892(-)
MGPTAWVFLPVPPWSETPASAPDLDRFAGGWSPSLFPPSSSLKPFSLKPPLSPRETQDAMSVRSGPCSPSVGPRASTGPTHAAGTDAMNLSTSAVCSSGAKAPSMRGTRCAASLARCCASAVLVACAVLAARWIAPWSRSRPSASVGAGPPPSLQAMSSTASSSAWVIPSKRESSASCSSSYAWATLLTLAASAGRTTSSSAATCARYMARMNPHRATSSSTSALSDPDASPAPSPLGGSDKLTG